MDSLENKTDSCKDVATHSRSKLLPGSSILKTTPSQHTSRAQKTVRFHIPVPTDSASPTLELLEFPTLSNSMDPFPNRADSQQPSPKNSYSKLSSELSIPKPVSSLQKSHVERNIRTTVQNDSASPRLRLQHLSMGRLAVPKNLPLKLSPGCSILKATPSPRTSHAQKIVRLPATLLTVPTEIRLEIYKYLLIGKSTRTINRRRCTEVICNRPPPTPTYWDSLKEPEHCCCSNQLSIAVLRTCKQIYREGVDVLYSQNHFAVGNRNSDYVMPNVKLFFDQIRPTNISYIQKLTLLIPCGRKRSLPIWYAILRLLALWAPLRDLTIRFTQYWAPSKNVEWKGVGFEQEMVKLLAMNQHLQTLRFLGPFDKTWVEYFAAKIPSCEVIFSSNDRYVISSEGLILPVQFG